MSLQVFTLDTPGLGDRSYLIVQGEVAVAIDPQRDIDRIESLLKQSSARLLGVFETHIHNDYITGGLQLARQHGAQYLVPTGPAIAFDATRVSDAEIFEFGTLKVKAISTPGHTDAHALYQVDSDNREFAFSGGSLLHGTVGRTDLLGKDRAEKLARAQYKSMHRLRELLSPDCEVMPTHGFGSLCSAEPASSNSNLFSEQLISNRVFLLSEDEFVSQILSRFGNYPTYYAFMGPRNAYGPMAGLPPLIAEWEFAQVVDARNAGTKVLDIRSGLDFSGGFLRDSVSVPAAGSIATWTGWILPPNEPLVIVANSQAEIDRASVELYRIGFDRIIGSYLCDGTEEWEAQLETTEFPDEFSQDSILLDVREANEFNAGKLAGAISIPLSELSQTDISQFEGERVFVYCQAGYRSIIASSLLAKRGIEPVWIQGELPSHRLVA